MFGKHDESHCPLDLWAPDRHTKVNNVAFSAYAKHQQELEDIIEYIVQEARAGRCDFSLSLWDELSDADVEYIEKEVIRRYDGG